jgi:hypothetical protein
MNFTVGKIFYFVVHISVAARRLAIFLSTPLTSIGKK